MSNDIKAGVVLVSQFVTSQSSVFSGYIDYINRDSATRNSNAPKYMMASLEEDIRKYNKYMGYMANPEKTTELFTKNKDVLTKSEKQSLQKLFETAQQNDSVMWQDVLSFDNRWLEQNGLYDSRTNLVNEAELRSVTRRCVGRMLYNEGLEMTAVWSAAIHYNTDNLHIHIAIVEPFPTTQIIQEGEYAGERKGKWKKETLKLGKSEVVNHILDNSKSNQLLFQLKQKQIMKPAQNNPLSMNAGMLSDYLDILEALPKGRNKWKYNMDAIKKVRPKIDAFVDKWIEQNYKEDFTQLREVVAQRQSVYDQAYGGNQNKYAANQIQSLYASLGNVVLKSMKTFSFEELQEDVFNQTIDYENDKITVHLKDAQYTAVLTHRANEGNSYAQYRLGRLYLVSSWEDYNVNTGIEYLAKAAEQNNVSAQYKLGSMYLENKLVEADPLKGINYLYAAAEQNHIYAQYKLGLLFLKGEIAGADYQKALHFFTSSAAQGNQFAQYQLGLIYLKGEVTRTNVIRAVNYFDKAAQQDNHFAMYQLGKLYYYGLEGHLEADKEKGLDYLSKAAGKGNEYAEAMLEQIKHPKRKGFFHQHQAARMADHMLHLFRQMGKEYESCQSMQNEQAYERLQWKIDNEVETDV